MKHIKRAENSQFVGKHLDQGTTAASLRAFPMQWVQNSGKKNLTLHIFVSFTLALIWRCKRVLLANGASRLCKYAASKTGTSLYDSAEITNCQVVTLSPTSFLSCERLLCKTFTYIQCLAMWINPNIFLK